jgi:hypothetical protein
MSVQAICAGQGQRGKPLAFVKMLLEIAYQHSNIQATPDRHGKF